jgi:hypothetical protein
MREKTTMTAALLAIAQAITSSAILPPVPLTPSVIRVAPTAAARALSVAALDDLPVAPRWVALQCLVGSDGALMDCVPADAGGTADLKVFRQRLAARRDRSIADPMVAAALARMPFYRILSPRAPGKATPSVLISESISLADRAPPTAPRGKIVEGGLRVDFAPGVSSAEFYPPAALRAGAQTRVTATCRVLGDHSLLCHGAEVDLPPRAGDPPLWRVPAHDADFARATLRVFATMRAQPRTVSGEDSVGRDVPLSMNWQLP